MPIAYPIQDFTPLGLGPSPGDTKDGSIMQPPPAAGQWGGNNYLPPDKNTYDADSIMPSFNRTQIGNGQPIEKASYKSDTVSDAIKNAASKYGVDPAYLSKAATIESGNNPNATSSTGASGLFQFTPNTAKAYGLTNATDPAQNADAAARLTLDNQATLTQALGRTPTNGELYLAHQQGAAGAVALLTHPNQNAVDALAPVYGGNTARAAQALTVNGGSTNQTAGNFANQWASKFGSPDTNATASQSPDNAPGAPLSITSPAQQQGTNTSAAKTAEGKYDTAVGIGNKIQSAFTTGISAPTLIQTTDTPATAPNANQYMEQLAESVPSA